jgi:hypothetical protein
MDPFDRNELSDGELDALLPEWKVPQAPARLRAALFPEPPKPWWRAIWSASIRIPLPAALCLALLLIAAAAYRDRAVYARAVREQANLQTLQPVTELRPRIIRSAHVPN